MEAGLHRYIWNGKDDRGINVSSGVYIYRLSVGKDIMVFVQMVVKPATK